MVTTTVPRRHLGCVLNDHHDSTATCVDHHITVDATTGLPLCRCGRGIAGQRAGGRDCCGPCSVDIYDALAEVTR